MNLDQATQDCTLDFFLLFSSIAGAVGNPGQADYAAANRFMDAFAAYRNRLVRTQQRSGTTLTLNWPLWKEGGMSVDQASETLMTHSTGMIPMSSASGIRAFYQALNCDDARVMVMAGNLAHMKRTMLAASSFRVSQAAKAAATVVPTADAEAGVLREKVQAALMQAVSVLLKVRLQDIDTDAELSEYGFDSISLTEFANTLNDKYRLELNPTVFFEYPTIGRVTDYLLTEYQDVLTAHFAVQIVPEISAPASEEDAKEPLFKKQRPRFVSHISRSQAKAAISSPERIAIVGMSGRFPMAADLHEFWRNLVEGRDCISEIPQTRWDWRKYYGDPTKEANKTTIKWGGFIEGVDEFDPLFFGISPREAHLMDPQQRLLMLYVWNVIEDAGYSAQRLSDSSTGIFVGTAGSEYSALIARANIPIEGYSATGMVSSVGPNRMSYFLNLHGPSEPVETACSSSLIAIHRAMLAIGTGSCEMAIVGGVNTILTPAAHISFNKAGMLCEDGRCKTFSAQANGYVRGEGVGMLFLKKLKTAQEDGDHIYAVIRSSAENHGGRANSLTAPNPTAQTALLKRAYTQPASIRELSVISRLTAQARPLAIRLKSTA